MAYGDNWLDYYENAHKLIQHGGLNPGYGKSLIKADDPILTTTSNFRNRTYGPEVFNWAIQNELGWMAILNKQPAPMKDSGFRIVTTNQAVTGGVAENGDLPDTDKPALATYYVKPKVIAHRWEETLHAQLDPDDPVGGDVAQFMRQYYGVEHASRMNVMLGADAQTTTNTLDNLESIDRVISSLSEATNIYTNATASNPWVTADTRVGKTNVIRAGVGLDLTSANDCVVKHASGSLRPLTLGLIDSVFDDVMNNKANRGDLMWVTGHDTASQWSRLLGGRERFVDKARVTVGFGGVTNSGTDTGFEVGTYRDVPIIELQKDIIVQDTDTNTSVAGSSRIYLIDRSSVFVRVSMPTIFGQVGGVDDYIRQDKAKDVSMLMTSAELVATKLKTSGKIRDISL